jgi:hypothetical protein
MARSISFRGRRSLLSLLRPFFRALRCARMAPTARGSGPLCNRLLMRGRKLPRLHNNSAYRRRSEINRGFVPSTIDVRVLIEIGPWPRLRVPQINVKLLCGELNRFAIFIGDDHFVQQVSPQISCLAASYCTPSTRVRVSVARTA